MAGSNTEIARYRLEIRLILWQTLAFAIRVAQFGLAVTVHAGIHRFVLPMAIPEAWRHYLLPLFEVIFFAAFSAMYTQQIFDMATIFVPWLRQKRSEQQATTETDESCNEQ